ncbi:hypothetical protein [Amycolatopsis sp.]|uniref:hypothetical protein n=1 Tax=Amycolatopsis sp. TaxID=37632 RepID=UPI0026314572|nr:hypothetical protein [Amycolatopsis sp.]
MKIVSFPMKTPGWRGADQPEQAADEADGERGLPADQAAVVGERAPPRTPRGS